jgi:hypothetical protein
MDIFKPVSRSGTHTDDHEGENKETTGGAVFQHVLAKVGYDYRYS